MMEWQRTSQALFRETVGSRPLVEVEICGVSTKPAVRLQAL